MADLGVPLAEEKTVSPDTILTVLGIEIETTVMQAWLPEDKKAMMVTLIGTMLRKEKMRVREVQVLLGHWNFACFVVRAGRTFCRRLGRPYQVCLYCNIGCVCWWGLRQT